MPTATLPDPTYPVHTLAYNFHIECAQIAVGIPFGPADWISFKGGK